MAKPTAQTYKNIIDNETHKLFHLIEQAYEDPEKAIQQANKWIEEDGHSRGLANVLQERPEELGALTDKERSLPAAIPAAAETAFKLDAARQEWEKAPSIEPERNDPEQNHEWTDGRGRVR